MTAQFAVKGAEAPHRARSIGAGTVVSAAPLGSKTKKLSGSDSLKVKTRRRTRFEQRRTLWSASKLNRVCKCGRRVAHNAQNVSVKKSEGVAHFAGVQLCGSIWACPVCSPRIRQTRAEELDAGLARWLELNPAGMVGFLTLTMPHDVGDSLAGLMDTIKAAWHAVLSGRRWQDDKADYGVAHYVRAWDATHGRNGWHAHKHIVLLFNRQVTDAELAALEARIFGRWRDAVVSRGFRAPTREHGVHCERARSRQDLVKYVMKIVYGENDSSLALEVARGDMKRGRLGGRTPWEILAEFCTTGCADSLELWHEWEKTTRGRQFLRWSHGAKKLLAVVERTDEEIVAEKIGGETVYTFEPEEWLAVCYTPAGQHRVLEIAEHSGGLEVRNYAQACLAVWNAQRRSKLRRGQLLSNGVERQ